MSTPPAAADFSPVRPDVWFDAAVKKALPPDDPANLTVWAVLSAPGEDLDGDEVVPTGLTWSGPVGVNLDHEPTPVVAQCFPEFKSIPFGRSRVTALAGRLVFDRADPVSRQAFTAVARGAVPGVSVEFEPLASTPLGYKSLTRGREARRWDRGRLTGLALCLNTIRANEWAEIVGDSVGKSVTSAAAEMLRSPDLPPVIHKGLKRVASITVPRTVGKAMPDDYPDPAMADPAKADPAAAADPISDTPPEASEAYDGAQVLLDLADRYRQLSSRTLHPASRKKFARWADALEKLAGEKSEHAEGVESEIAGDAEAGVAEGDADDAETDDVPPDDDEVGEMKSLPRDARGGLVTKSGYRPRWRYADLKPAPAADPMTTAERRSLAEKRRRIAALERQLTTPRR